MRIYIYNLFHKPLFLLAEIFYLIVVPLGLMNFFPQLIHLRLGLFVLGLLYVWRVSQLLGLNLKDFGLHTSNFTQSVKNLLTPTLSMIVFVALLYAIFPAGLYTSAFIKESAGYPLYLPLAVYVLVSVPLQEILFRAFFIPRLSKVSTDPIFLVFLSATIFGIVHIALGNIFLTLASTVLGFVWGYNFVRYRNIYAIMVSHALVGSAYIYALHLAH